MSTRSRFAPTRMALLVWCLFIGVGAVAGAVGMLSAPDGSVLHMQDMLPAFQVLPFADLLFQDFVFPGLALLCVNGIPNLIAAALLLAKKKAGVVLGGVLGVTLMLWIVIQFIIFPFNVLSTAYFIFGLIQATTGFAAVVFARQEEFAALQTDYPGIGGDPTRLVVYFSRMGYTRQAALEEADRTGAQVCQLRTDEPTAGTSGFWWCGRYAMHRWPMSICDPGVDLSAFRHVTICTPVWVLGPAAPIRAFCQLARGKVAEVDYILVHHMRGRCLSAAGELDALLGLSSTPVRSICCRQGRRLGQPIQTKTPAAAPKS